MGKAEFVSFPAQELKQKEPALKNQGNILLMKKSDSYFPLYWLLNTLSRDP